MDKQTPFSQFDLLPTDERHTALMAAIKRVTDTTFDELALGVFRYQARYNPLYAQYLSLLSCNVAKISAIHQIPYLPISLFKNYAIRSGEWDSERIFKSSGTTGQVSSAHHLRSAEWYRQNSRRAFELQYGPLSDYCFLALLPSYLERGDSSLVFMADHFIRSSGHSQSGFFLDNQSQLVKVLRDCQKDQIQTVLIGVSFALLDLAENHQMDLSDLIIMETGGMKGRRRELTRAELHAQLKTAFRVEAIHSEYGMTELLSQAYSTGDGYFVPAPTMKAICRELTDPMAILPAGRNGPLNIIDLANLDTCSFIATDDIGRVSTDGNFEVLGRLDYSEMRGCNLMVM